MLVAAWYVVQIYHFLFKMKTPWSAIHWYGIVWYYMVRYGLVWHPSSTFSFKWKDLVVCTHWNFLSNPTDPTKLTHGKGRPRAISCAGQSCQRRKVQTYVVISPLGDAWIFLKLFMRVLSIIWLAWFVVCCIEDPWPWFVVCQQEAKLPNCQWHPDWRPPESL